MQPPLAPLARPTTRASRSVPVAVAAAAGAAGLQLLGAVMVLLSDRLLHVEHWQERLLAGSIALFLIAIVSTLLAVVGGVVSIGGLARGSSETSGARTVWLALSAAVSVGCFGLGTSAIGWMLLEGALFYVIGKGAR